MNWPKEKPTVPGFYWLRNPDGFVFPGVDRIVRLDELLYGEWQGPLAPEG